MHHGRGGVRADSAAVAPPGAGLTRHLAAAILVLSAAGFLTQCLAIATGRDFMAGLIPKLNPGGTRNLPVWFASAVFALSAAFAALAGQARRGNGTMAGRWVALAALLALLSAERLASLSSSIAHLVPDPPAPLLVLTGIGAALTAGAYLWCIHDLPRRVQVHFVAAAAVFTAGAALCSWAPSADASAAGGRLIPVLMISAGRLLELTGATLFIDAVVRHLLSRFTEVRARVEARPGRPLDGRIRGDALEIRLSRRRIGIMAAASGAVLLVAGAAAAAAHELTPRDLESLYRMLGVDFEGNLPTWYSSVLLLAIAAASAVLAAARRQGGDRLWRGWLVFALLMGALSADEAAGLHELTVMPLRALLRDNPWLRYPLVLPGAAAAALVYAGLARFFRALDQATRHRLYAGFGLLLAGALGLETISGWYDPVLHGPSLTYILLSTAEEACEIAGALVLLDAVLRHAGRDDGVLIVRGSPAPAA